LVKGAFLATFLAQILPVQMMAGPLAKELAMPKEKCKSYIILYDLNIAK